MKQKHIFTTKDIWKLLLPLMVEQLLTQLMGTIDTMMVSNIGSEAISAVSLVDSINILLIQAFTALAAGGTIICSQYMGAENKKEAHTAANQLLLSISVLAFAIAAVCLIFRKPMLSLIFGAVEPGVMKNSQDYFLYTALSFPFLAWYNAGAAIFRAQKNSRTPMLISVSSNVLNVIGNAFLIWGLHMGVAGAAIATLLSRAYCGILVMLFLRNPNRDIVIRNYSKIRYDRKRLRQVLLIGIPSAVENSMFQFGKLVIQSTVSTLGTAAIAAQAMTNLLELFNGIAPMSVGIGMMTVIGQCIGAGREDEAVYYVKRLTIIAELVMFVNIAVIMIATRPITILGGMEAESAAMCISMMTAISIVKPIVWVLAFVPAYGMRAAGDVKFSMISSITIMWVFRVTMAILLCRLTDIGPMGVWVAMFTDWTVRAIVCSIRFHSRRWLGHKVLS